MRRLGMRHRTIARRTRVIAACLLVVVVVAGVLGGVHGVDVAAAPVACLLLPDLAGTSLLPAAPDVPPPSVAARSLLPPRAPPVPLFA